MADNTKVRCEACRGTGWIVIGGGEIVDRIPCEDCENGLRPITTEDLREAFDEGCSSTMVMANKWLRERYGVEKDSP